MKNFILGQIHSIRKGGYPTLSRKIKLALVIVLQSPLFVVAFPIVLSLRIIRPWLLVRFCGLESARIGHFAGNTEIHLCEYDSGVNQPVQRHIDLFYFKTRPVSNQQLAKMWKRTINVWPAWVLAPIDRINHLVPDGKVHEIGSNTQHDRDVYNLYDKLPPHLEFTEKEEAKGRAQLRLMGLPIGAPFVCIIARDSAYLNSHITGVDFTYHNHRDVDVKNYLLAAEELANRGYYVFRMGVMVEKPLNSSHHMVIDYASNGMRSDFMDIYLGAKCAFCLSSYTGYDSVSAIFRRPLAFVDHAPLGYLVTYQQTTIGIVKRHVNTIEDQKLSLKETLASGVAFALRDSSYESKGMWLIDNTPEEIRDVVIEMDERLNGTWQPHEDDDRLQQKFWEIFPTDSLDRGKGKPLHGEIKSRFGASFLRNNRWWLE